MFFGTHHWKELFFGPKKKLFSTILEKLKKIILPSLLECKQSHTLFIYFLQLCSILFALWKVKDVNVARKIPPIWDLSLPLQALKCMFKKRAGNRRKNVILMILVPSTTTITFASKLTYELLRDACSENRGGFL